MVFLGVLFSQVYGVSHAYFQPDTTLPFPIEIQDNYPFSNSNSSPLYLDNPANITPRIVFDPITGTYVFEEKIGSWNYRTPTVMSQDQFRQFQYNRRFVITGS